MAEIDTMNGAELVDFLVKETRTLQELRERPELYVGRMKHRALERIGELLYAPGIHYLVRDVDFYFPRVGDRFIDNISELGAEFSLCPAPSALVMFGDKSIPHVHAGLAREKHRSRRFLLEITLTKLGISPDVAR